MYGRIRQWVLAALKVPPEPHPPFGRPESLRVFRAGKNYFNLKLLAWGVAQVVALAGILFWLVVLIDVESEVQRRRQAPPPAPVPAAPAPVPAASAPTTTAAVESTAPAASPVEQPKRRKRTTVKGWAGFKLALVELGLRLPAWAFPLLWVLKIGGLLAYAAQVPVTLMLRRLDYEMRWYIVTDRSLRLRAGTWKVQEITMSFANLQQVEVTQGPVQRLLGLADVRVQSAGGGNSDSDPHADDTMHKARFHGVDNAHEIRDLILDRLRRYRAAGLGDPDDHQDDHSDSPPPPAAEAGVPDVVAAARELAAEAKALRTALG